MSTPPLSVLFEDEWIIAVNKEAGQLVHSNKDPQPDDIVTMKLVREYLGLKVYPTHRLDRPTCGVLLLAKGKTAARAINRAFERKQIQKSYHTIIHGAPKQDSWTCSQELQKKPTDPLKSACTEFKVLQQLSPDFALLKASPQTGRYHQIRKHLLHCGHPIVGDYLYTGIEACEKTRLQLEIGTRMMLQCKSLTLAHPITKDSLTIEAPIEECFEKIVKQTTPSPHTPQ